MNKRCNAYRLMIFVICFGMFWETPAAQADVFWRKAILACSKDSNQFVIRFGTLWNEDTIDKAELVETSPQIMDLYKTLSVAPNGQCKLPDGKKVEVRSSSSQSFGYGMGGGDPDSNFTLKIDGLPIFYKKKYYLGYGQEKSVINSIFYDDGSLYQDVSGRLAPKDQKYPESVLSKDEQKELYKDRTRASIKDNLSEFCKELLRARTPSKYSNLEKIPLGFLSSLDLDVNNDGKIDKVFRVGGGSSDCGVSCGTHYFDGSFLIAFTDGDNYIPQFLKDMNDAQKEREESYPFNLNLGVKSIEEIPEWKAYFISYSPSANTARYIYNIPFSYKGTNYIEAFEVKEEAVPRRSIVKMTPDNKLMPVCKYTQ